MWMFEIFNKQEKNEKSSTDLLFKQKIQYVWQNDLFSQGFIWLFIESRFDNINKNFEEHKYQGYYILNKSYFKGEFKVWNNFNLYIKKNIKMLNYVS